MSTPSNRIEPVDILNFIARNNFSTREKGKLLHDRQLESSVTFKV